jgi:hypothetical protein
MANSSSNFSFNLQMIECFEEANEESPTQHQINTVSLNHSYNHTFHHNRSNHISNHAMLYITILCYEICQISVNIFLSPHAFYLI